MERWYKLSISAPFWGISRSCVNGGGSARGAVFIMGTVLGRAAGFIAGMLTASSTGRGTARYRKPSLRRTLAASSPRSRKLLRLGDPLDLESFSPCPSSSSR